MGIVTSHRRDAENTGWPMIRLRRAAGAHSRIMFSLRIRRARSTGNPLAGRAICVLCVSAVSLLLLLHAPPAIAQESDRASLVAAARMAGDYLVRMQLEDGSFHYSYNPV